ncbi:MULTISPECIES: MrpH family fimbial adhesin [Serratia]|uniref:MrpH family fimbial adhesin n=1 Tax=Serratia TaxID=613 RepID=UPI0039BF5A04
MKPLFIFCMLFISLQAKASWELDVKYFPQDNQVKVNVIRWDVNDSSRNLLYNCWDPIAASDQRCRLFIAFDNEERGATLLGEPFNMGKEVSGLRTMGEVAAVFARKGYLNQERSGGAQLIGRRNCFALAWKYPTGFHGPLPNGAVDCALPEITPTYCSIREPYIELDHGSVTSERVNGHTVSHSFRVACNNNFKVLIVAQGGKGDLPLGGGITSHLKVNGDDLGAGHAEMVGPTGKSFTLSSTLSGFPSGAGEFQGSKVIILSLP